MEIEDAVEDSRFRQAGIQVPNGLILANDRMQISYLKLGRSWRQKHVIDELDYLNSDRWEPIAPKYG